MSQFVIFVVIESGAAHSRTRTNSGLWSDAWLTGTVASSHASAAVVR